MFANEFFDALPVEILSEKGALRVATRDGRFVEEWAPPSAEELEFLDRYGVHPENGMRTEAGLLCKQTMTQIAANIERGFLIAIDYGYTREQQLAGRHLDTVMAYRRHSATPDPYQSPGEQDITAHVNFTALAPPRHTKPACTSTNCSRNRNFSWASAKLPNLPMLSKNAAFPRSAQRSHCS